MEKLIIDTDPGIDDAVAIILAIQSGQFDIQALTTVCGNCSVDQGTENAFKILDIALASHIPVYKGADKPLIKKFIDATDTHGDDGMGNINYQLSSPRIVEKDSASDYLIKAVQSAPHEIIIAPIGPLTNIAIAVQKDPSFAQKVKRLVIMGGGECDGNCSPVAEFNFWDDPDAAKIVFEAGFPEIVMVGLNATRKIVLTPNLREMVKQFRSPLGDFIHSITQTYIDFHWAQEKTIGCVINDALVIAYLLDPNVLKLKKAYVDIATEGICEGQSVIDNKGFWHQGHCNAQVAYDADTKRFFEIFFNILFPKHQEDIDIVLDYEFGNKK